MLCCEEKINQSKPLIDFDIFQPTRCLSNLDEIAIRVPYVTANLNTMVLWLCNEFLFHLSYLLFPFSLPQPSVLIHLVGLSLLLQYPYQARPSPLG
jgi:hypothetical protein